MENHDKTKDELIRELQELHQANNSLKVLYEKDITVFKQAEEALRANDVLLQSALNILPVGVWVFNVEGKIVTSNATAQQIWAGVRYLGVDQLGEYKGWRTDTGKLIEAHEWAGARALKKGETSIEEEVEIECFDGTHKIILDTAVPLLKSDGSINGAITINQDITERRRTNQKLEEQNKELVFQNQEKEKRAAELIIANKKLSFENEEKEKRAEELIIANKELTFQNDEKEKRAAELIIANKELAFQNDEKEKRAEELIIANKELAFQNDEKEKRAAELAIAKEHAEESDRLKSAFLANMSHEIRTPMNGILGFSELLKEPNLSGKQQQEYIKIIEKSGARMLNIINNIVDISKIEAGLMKVDIKDTNINEKIEFIYTFFKPQAEEKRMHLIFRNTLTTKEAKINTDGEKVISIFSNLVKNAIKYTDEGAIEFGYIKKDDCIECYVKDTGIGIPEERQTAIFERFIQADIADKQARQGAGLGLSIAKAYVEMLGGKIWVESEPEKGSTFYFTLPCNTEVDGKNTTRKNVPVEEVANQIKKLKILIAEDDETSKMLISITVKDYSKEVLEASTGIEAVEICRNNHDLDLVLMDIQMPEMNGHEATRQIRQFNKEVAIIAHTAFGLSGDREKAINAGCNDYISKPINKAELHAIIQKHLKKQLSIQN